MTIGKFVGAAAAAALVAFVIAAPGAQAATITVYNTGVNNSNVVLPDDTIGDPHYSLISVPGGPTEIRVRTEIGGFPVGGGAYIGDDGLSGWIGPNSGHTLEGPAGNYTYRTTFDLTGLNPSTALITGQWSSDNPGVDILINGHSTGQAHPGEQAYNNWASFVISSFFQSGTNTLDFVVYNQPCDCGNPTALRVEFTSAEAIATPLPAALPLFAGGLGVLGLVARRRKKKAEALAAAA